VTQVTGLFLSCASETFALSTSPMARAGRRASVHLRRAALNNKTTGHLRRAALVAGLLAASSAALGGELKSLTVCADPGNMPLSNQKGEDSRTRSRK